MKYFSTFVLLLCASLFIQVFTIEFEDCGKGEVKAIKCTACQVEPCELQKGKKVEVEIDFTPEKVHDNVNFGVSASVFGIEMDLPVEDPTACGKHIACPLKAGELNTFKYQLDVDEMLPSMSVNVKFQLKSKEDVIACASTSVRLVDAEDSKEAHDEF